MARPQPFRIAHLSDLHLTRKDNLKRSEPKLFGALRGMNDAFRRIVTTREIQESDFVLVTGDVTDRGDLESWRVFWSAVRGAGLADRIRVVPGNHDVCWLGAVRLPGRELEKTDLERAVAGLKLGRQPTKFPWVVQPDPRVVIFGLNSNNLGNLSSASNAMGEICYYQLKSLARKLYQHRDVPVKIIALHHSPNIPESDTARRRGQAAFSSIKRLAHQIPEEHRHGLMLLSVAHRVRLVMHGHLHLKEDRRITGIRIVGAPATTQPQRADGRQYGFFTYTVHGAGGRLRCKFCSVRI